MRIIFLDHFYFSILCYLVYIQGKYLLCNLSVNCGQMVHS